MYTDEHEPLPHPDPGPGEPEYQYAGDLPKITAPSISPPQSPTTHAQDINSRRAGEAATRGLDKYFGGHISR